MKKTLIALTFICPTAFAQQGQMPQQPDLVEMFFKQFDSNKDGLVSKAEFMKPTEAQFDHMDRDKNGSLNPVEVKAFNDEMEQRMQEMQRKMQQQYPQGMQRR